MKHGTPRWAVVAVVVTAALGCVACAPEAAELAASVGGSSPAESAPSRPAIVDRTVVTGAGHPGDEHGDVGEPRTLAPPRRILLPTIEVDAPIVDLGLTADGALETPTDFDVAGWWAGGTLAHEAGPTVIIGHVDDYRGPAVFFRLAELEPGDPIVVVDDHGERSTFRVVDTELYDKAAFPVDLVYGPDDDPTLRLVTCGGDFDRSARSYESNLVVYAVEA